MLFKGSIDGDTWPKINELEEENEELKCELDAYSNLIIENKELKTKLNETISCKDYESEAREYFSHNPQGDKVSFFMFDNDYITQNDIDESMEICTIYNDNI